MMNDEERYPWLTPELKNAAYRYSLAMGGGYYDMLDAVNRLYADAIIEAVDFEKLIADVKALDNAPWYVKAWWRVQTIVMLPVWWVRDLLKAKDE